MKNLSILLKSLPYPNQKIQLVDVGARWGTNPPWDQVEKDFVKYLGFEADIVECQNLMLKYESKDVEYLPLGVADVNGEYFLNLTRELGCSSIFDPNHNLISRFFLSENWDVIKTILIKTVLLSQILDEKNITPDILKIDVQGAALKVLQGAGKYLHEISFVEVEVEFCEMYKGQSLFGEVDKYMREHGFELLDMNKYYAKRKILSAKHASRGQVLFADILYVKAIDKFNELQLSSEKKLKRLWNLIAILCIYGHFDYAVEYGLNKESGLSKYEQASIVNSIKKFTAIPKWKLILFNNNLIEKVGLYLSIVANSLQIKSRLFGWGSDQNSVDVRYKYYFKHPLLKLFRK